MLPVRQFKTHDSLVCACEIKMAMLKICQLLLNLLLYTGSFQVAIASCSLHDQQRLLEHRLEHL